MERKKKDKEKEELKGRKTGKKEKASGKPRKLSANGKNSLAGESEGRTTRGLWGNFRDGRSLSITFFKRNGWLILLVIVAVIWLIGQRYSNQSRMEEIKGLEKELRRAESRKLDAKADYMSLIRESRMKELMEKNNLQISYQEQPPYVLTED